MLKSISEATCSTVTTWAAPGSQSRRTIATLLVCLCANSPGQSLTELQNDATSTGDIVTYGMSYGLQRFSPLEQINTKSVGDLVPAWSFSLGDDRGQEGLAAEVCRQAINAQGQSQRRYQHSEMERCLGPARERGDQGEVEAH